MLNKMLAAGGVAVYALGAGVALAQDAEMIAEGEKIFRRCAACHMVGPEAQNRVGPILTGVIGRTAGTLEDFNYSDAMIEAGQGGLVWDVDTLNPYLENPKEMVPGTKMVFPGLRDEADRLAVIEYIRSAGGEAEPAS